MSNCNAYHIQFPSLEIVIYFCLPMQHLSRGPYLGVIIFITFILIIVTWCAKFELHLINKFFYQNNLKAYHSFRILYTNCMLLLNKYIHFSRHWLLLQMTVSTGPFSKSHHLLRKNSKASTKIHGCRMHSYRT